MARKRYTKPGDLKQLQRVMWQAILDTKALTDRPRPSAATVLKVGHCLAQLSGAYRALVQDSELEARIKALEERANGSP